MGLLQLIKSKNREILRCAKIKIGHNHGEAKMLAVRKFPELFEVIRYAEENEEWIQKRGNKGYQGLTRYTVDELLERRAEVLVETGGKHIHMNKPASGALEEDKEVLDITKEKNVIVQLGYIKL